MSTEDILGESGQRTTGERLNPKLSKQEAPFVLLPLLLVLPIRLLLVFLLILFIISFWTLLHFFWAVGIVVQARAAPRPGQPHGEGALGSGEAKKMKPDKLILVAFVI